MTALARVSKAGVTVQLVKVELEVFVSQNLCHFCQVVSVLVILILTYTHVRIRRVRVGKDKLLIQ